MSACKAAKLVDSGAADHYSGLNNFKDWNIFMKDRMIISIKLKLYPSIHCI